MAQGRIDYQVGFKIDQSALKQLKSSLQEIQKMSYTDVMKNTGSNLKEARDSLNSIKRVAGDVEIALEKAFNTKLNKMPHCPLRSIPAVHGRIIDANKLKNHYSWWGDCGGEGAERKQIFDTIVDLQPTIIESNLEL